VLAGEAPVGGERVGVRRHVQHLRELRVRDLAVVALEEVLADDLPVRLELGLPACVEDEVVHVEAESGGTANTAYSQTLTGSGGTAPYTFAVTAGTLPAGLTLSAAGLLSGTPTATGTFNFTVTGTDSVNCAATRARGRAAAASRNRGTSATIDGRGR